MFDYIPLDFSMQFFILINNYLLSNSITIKSVDDCNWTVGQGNNWYPAMIH